MTGILKICLFLSDIYLIVCLGFNHLIQKRCANNDNRSTWRYFSFTDFKCKISQHFVRIVTFTSKIRKKNSRKHISYSEEREKSPARLTIPVWCFIARWHNPVLCCQLVHMKSKTKKLTTSDTLEQGFAHVTVLVTILLMTSTMYYKCILLLILQIKLQQTVTLRFLPYGNTAPSVLLQQAGP